MENDTAGITEVKEKSKPNDIGNKVNIHIAEDLFRKEDDYDDRVIVHNAVGISNGSNNSSVHLGTNAANNSNICNNNSVSKDCNSHLNIHKEVTSETGTKLNSNKKINYPSNTNNINNSNNNNLSNLNNKSNDSSNSGDNNNNPNSFPNPLPTVTIPISNGVKELANINNNTNNYNNTNNNYPASLNMSDFVVNVVDESEKGVNVVNSNNIGDFENSLGRNDAHSGHSGLSHSIQKNDPKSNARFAKTIVVLSPTEEKKEEQEVVNEAPRRDTRQGNPRQKKPSTVQINISENESVLFFFINPSSGVEEGKHLINMGVKKVEFTDSLHCTAYIFNVNEENNLEIGIDKLRNELERISLIRVIIGGGDGTVLNIIERLNFNGVDINRIIFGVLPLGRTNDLSRALGWGEKMVIDSDMAKFKLIVQDLAEATSIFVDLWEMKLVCDEKDGGIVQYDTNLQVKRSAESKSMKRLFINYFSLGFDARVGFGFNKSKSKYRCLNFLSYFWEALKKTCCRKPLPVKDFIHSFNVVKLEEDIIDMNYNENVIVQNETQKELEAVKDIVFLDKEEALNKNKQIDFNASNRLSSSIESLQPVVLKGNPLGLVCQNINYFIGGPADIWRNSRDNFGLEVFEEIDLRDKEAVKVLLVN